MAATDAIDIIHYDQALIVVNKPAGLPVLPDGWDAQAPYLLDQLQQSFGRLWVVHRLDKVTSGVMILARSAAAHRMLSIQFERHEAIKIYDAIASGSPPWNEKVARHRLRVNVGHQHRTQVDHRHGKSSETAFTVQTRWKAHTLIEARPLTGRSHQVRAHLAALGHPLLGDALYGAPPTALIGRPALHARSLGFRHPETSQPLTFTAPWADDFTRALSALKSGQI